MPAAPPPVWSISPPGRGVLARTEELARLREEHAPAAVAERFERGPSRRYLRDFVYGAVDGVVTTLAVVAGATGADLSARAKGFAGADLDRVVDVVTSSSGSWVDTMMTEEHGFAVSRPVPIRSALATMVAFVLAGFVPLAAYVADVSGVPVEGAFAWTATLTALAFAVVGALKSRFVAQGWWRSSLETVVVGGIAAGFAFVVGVLLKGIG